MVIQSVHKLVFFLVCKIIGSIGGVRELRSMDHLLNIVVPFNFTLIVVGVIVHVNIFVRSHLTFVLLIIIII